MIQVAIIIFRDILEISIILSILMAATNGIKDRNFWIWTGILLGILGSLVLAIFTDQLANSFEGIGLEIFNAVILLIAALMIAYIVIWMKIHTRSLSKTIKETGIKVREGERSSYTICVIVTFSILREGAEIFLFTYSYYTTGTSALDLTFGAILGVILGTFAGFLVYFGLASTLGKYFFRVTTIILIFLSAGLVAQSLGYLTSAEVLPRLIDQVWDSSSLVSDKSILGKILHVITGYVARPSAIQLIGYSLTVILLFFLVYKKRENKEPPS